MRWPGKLARLLTHSLRLTAPPGDSREVTLPKSDDVVGGDNRGACGSVVYCLCRGLTRMNIHRGCKQANHYHILLHEHVAKSGPILAESVCHCLHFESADCVVCQSVSVGHIKLILARELHIPRYYHDLHVEDGYDVLL